MTEKPTPKPDAPKPVSPILIKKKDRRAKPVAVR